MVSVVTTPRFSTAAISKVSLVDAASAYAASSRAKNTERAYQGDLRRFASWCRQEGVQALPASPQSVALYLTFLAEDGRRPSTIRRAKSAIAQAHRLRGIDPPPTDDARVRQVERGIRRQFGTAPHQVAPMLPDQLRLGLDALGSSTLAVRDRAMLLLGFGAAMRRSELVALDVEDVEFAVEGLVVNVRRSKTDAEGVGARIAIPFGDHRTTCPVRAMREWFTMLGTAPTGPLFRVVRGNAIFREHASDRSVARAVKRVAEAAGLDPEKFAGHSLRAGLATAASRAGKVDRAIMRQGRWKSRATVDAYVRQGTMWSEENAADGIGL